MKVSKVIELLSAADLEAEVVAQRNYEDGSFSLHSITIQELGHIGHSGPVIHVSYFTIEELDQKKGPR